ncbi:hypothetical protein [Actinoplanes derwentensis]|uniref:Uncharacterized protein n=1 Tax=Actinoplanes derwentensis TaxID=113562 RepID=A0A1H2DBC0_9ACTN|nr:hypothetical protein [Actinoplanes derwentensis]GID81805.1 hypothetical protein Ade03nite_07290 [Actinoplanes derwentensis]SDT79887.1 hypothetical protein SAMN04489716_8972 [Actinoplanes derwentensis]
MPMSRKLFSWRPSAALLVGLAGLGLVMSAAGPSVLNSAGSFVPVSQATDQVAPKDHQAVAVSVVRTRGRNNISTFQVAGSGNSYSSEVLRLASSPAFRTLGPRYAPVSKSGRYRYEVTVRYRNGKQKQVVTYSKTPGTPQVLLDLIKRTETVPMPVFPPGFPFN